MSELAGKAGIVTGAGVGIGRAIAIAMAGAGAKVVVADLNAETATETVALIELAGGEAIAFTADVSQEAQVQALVACCSEHFGSLDIACNSAAVSRGSCRCMTMSLLERGAGTPGLRTHVLLPSSSVSVRPCAVTEVLALILTVSSTHWPPTGCCSTAGAGYVVRWVKDRLPRVISEKTCLFVYFIKDMSLTCLLGD